MHSLIIITGVWYKYVQRKQWNTIFSINYKRYFGAACEQTSKRLRRYEGWDYHEGRRRPPQGGLCESTEAAGGGLAGGDSTLRCCWEAAEAAAVRWCRPKPTGNPAWKEARDCSSAAECSWALRRSSATLEERWSLPGVGVCGCSSPMGFMGQHEHSPGNAANIVSLTSKTKIRLALPQIRPRKKI